MSATTTGRDGFFTFPDPVNETAVRVTATGVAVIALLAIVMRQPALLVLIALGFWARVLAGPRLSPLALLSTRVVTPRLPGPHRLVPGSPKRFAQGLGAGASTAATVLYFAGLPTAAWVLAAVIVVLATLEASIRLCVGCLLYGVLVRRGVIDAPECEECHDISLRRHPAQVAAKEYSGQVS